MNDLPYSIGNEVCLRGDNAGNPGALAKLPPIPLSATAILSIVFDSLIVFETRKIEASFESFASGDRRLQKKRKAIKKLIYSVPVRATVFSALTSVPIIVIAAMLFIAGMSKITISMTVFFNTLVIVATRSVVMTRAIFSNKKQEDLRSREERQRREREFALQEKIEREMKKRQFHEQQHLESTL